MSSLPDILKVQTLPTVDNMKISTQVLDPITITDSLAVFQIPKAGILDAGSFVQLGVTVSADGSFFFPLGTGVHAMIEKCVLKIGNQVVASNTQYPYYSTASRKFDSPEHRAYVDMVKSGCCGDRYAISESGRIAYRDLDATVSSTATNTDLTVPSFIKPTTLDSTTALFSVPLSTLIPMMRSRQLPLFAIKEHVYLEITFAQQTSDSDIGKVCCRAQTSSDSGALVPSKSNIKFIFDALYYTDSAMDSVMSQVASDSGMNILYEDQIVTDTQVPATTTGSGVEESQVIEREIMVSGRVLRSLLIQEKNVGENHKFLGEYISRDTKIPSQLNYRINDQRIYDRDIVLPTRKYDELANVMGRPLMTPSQLYSFDADTDKSQVTQPLNQQSTYIGKVEGHQCPAADNTNALGDTDFRATDHYEGLDLTTSGFNQLGNGTRVGVKPIRILKKYTRTSDDKSAREMKIFASVERIMLLKKGEVTLSE